MGEELIGWDEWWDKIKVHMMSQLHASCPQSILIMSSLNSYVHIRRYSQDFIPVRETIPGCRCCINSTLIRTIAGVLKKNMNY